MLHKKIDINDYNYTLPPEKIAKYPLAKRDDSRLLIYKPNEKIKDAQFKNLIDFVPKGSTLVFNNSKVIQARILFQKSTGATVEVFCLEPVGPHDYQLAIGAIQKCSWKCMVGNLKKWKEGELVKNISVKNRQFSLYAKKLKKEKQEIVIEFRWDEPDISFGELIEYVGLTPLPPYIDRPAEAEDKIRYQTIYAEPEGSVAAPTAGLHFTKPLISDLRKKDITTVDITLHVGAGTFQPIQTENVSDHSMHAEHITITQDLIKKLLSHNNPLYAVGTTSVRTLESIYWLGVKILSKPKITRHELFISQWGYSNYCLCPSREEALSGLLDYMYVHHMKTFTTKTQIMIIPGYSFKMVEGLITNFHLPKSSLLLLIAAFIGKDWEQVYQHALENNYRFLSYGDSSLLFPI